MSWGITIGLMFFLTGMSVMLLGIALFSYDQTLSSEWLSIPNVPWLSIPLPEWLSIPIPYWISVSHTHNTIASWIYMILGIGGLILGTVVIYISNQTQR